MLKLKSMMHRIQLTIFSVLFLAVFALNAFIICNAWLGAVLLFLFLAVFGWELGGVITNGEKAVLRWWIGVWILISILLVTLSIFYYAWKITEELSVVIILICVPVILWASRRFSHKTFFAHAHDLWRTKKHKIPQVVLIGSSLAVLALCVMLLSVAQNPITDSVRSVWERMPQAVFICFSAACALIFALLMTDCAMKLAGNAAHATTISATRAVALIFFVRELRRLGSVARKAKYKNAGMPESGCMKNVAAQAIKRIVRRGCSFSSRYGTDAKINNSVQRLASACGVVTIKDESGIKNIPVIVAIATERLRAMCAAA